MKIGLCACEVDLKMGIALKATLGLVKDILTGGVCRCGDKFKGESKYLGGGWMDDFLVRKVVEG